MKCQALKAYSISKVTDNPAHRQMRSENPIVHIYQKQTERMHRLITFCGKAL